MTRKEYSHELEGRRRGTAGEILARIARVRPSRDPVAGASSIVAAIKNTAGESREAVWIEPVQAITLVEAGKVSRADLSLEENERGKFISFEIEGVPVRTFPVRGLL